MPQISMIVPQFFSRDIPATLAYYRDRLGFETAFLYGDPPSYAGAARDRCLVYFRHVDAPMAFPAKKYEDELLDAYFQVSGVGRLHSELERNGVTFARGLGHMPWQRTEFVVRDCEGRLLCFGEDAGDS